VRFLADESCDFAVVTALRTAGHDVSAVGEINPGAEDPAVLVLWLAPRLAFFSPKTRTSDSSCMRAGRTRLESS
jgi:hypothetical protein